LHPVAGHRTLRERLLLLWDLAIIVLVSVNLVLIAFDMLFTVHALAALLARVSPAVHDWYAHTIHAHFLAIDLGFVAVFVFDVALGWSMAIVQRRFYRWYFYPFVHWYDVLGCIPVGGFRLLRVLRVVSILIRLQHLGLIDIRNWRLYGTFMVYYDILVEELSDRVVIKVLSGVQDEVASGGNVLTKRVVREVIQPRRQQLARVTSDRIERAVTRAWADNRKEIHGYIARLVHSAVRGNRALGRLERVPKLGSYVTNALDQAITSTVHDVLDEAVSGLETEQFDQLVEHISDTVIAQLLELDAGEPSELSDALVEVLDLVKDQVAVQQWRSHFE